MSESYYTIGMAGHIDHGKTTLTKKLTNVDTDRLKEEKERGISIELGYAPLETEDGTHISIVDVPGHERFIRQMIAGVAGIDLVVLVIAADEGVMPQTEEHLEILQFLGIKHGIVAVSKIDRVDEELLELVTEDIQERLKGTVFEQVPYVFVDSLSGKGIDELRKTISRELEKVPFRDAYGSFRLPIDQVFTSQGQGTVVRGTIYEGIVRKGSELILLPKGQKVKARQIQVHRHEQEEAKAGQRTAINLSGVDKTDVVRGDVLVSSEHFLVTDTIDVALMPIDTDFTPLKQRAPVKVHVGTSEVMGKIVFFDRNQLERSPDEVLCQIRLEEQIVVRRGDRFILRRPTPVETLGGGWVIEPKGGKYRFGEETMTMLKQQKEGTPEDLIEGVLSKHVILDVKQLLQLTSLTESDVLETLQQEIKADQVFELPGRRYGLKKTLWKLRDELTDKLEEFHLASPMRVGMSKAELIQSLSARYPKTFIEYGLTHFTEEGLFKKIDQFLALSSFAPHFPQKWKVRMEGIVQALEQDGIQVKKWPDYFAGSPIPERFIAEMEHFLVQSGQAYRLTEDMLIHRKSFESAIVQLKDKTSSAFGLKEAKEALDVSRKYLIPMLELLDEQKLTVRADEQRVWA